jgi:two-component system cell cycle sensor histidine kinase PleC
MTAEQAELALQPFRQVDGRLSRRYEGVGLGLSIAKALVDVHGGRLKIISVPNKGACVVLSFPARHCAATRKPGLMAAA